MSLEPPPSAVRNNEQPPIQTSVADQSKTDPNHHKTEALVEGWLLAGPYIFRYLLKDRQSEADA
jgi:hypothetical protein